MLKRLALFMTVLALLAGCGGDDGDDGEGAEDETTSSTAEADDGGDEGGGELSGTASIFIDEAAGANVEAALSALEDDNPGLTLEMATGQFDPTTVGVAYVTVCSGERNLYVVTPEYAQAAEGHEGCDVEVAEADLDPAVALVYLADDELALAVVDELSG